MNNRTWLLTIILLLFSVLTVQATDYHAVCVGIWDYYPGTADDLPVNCVNDATDLRDYLVDYQDWNNSNIELKTNSSATASAITSAINNMPNSTGNSELFYYCGHGNTSGIRTYSGTISPSTLQNTFGSSYNQYCAFINACHSGVFVNQMSKGEISSACKSDESTYADGEDGHTYFGQYVLAGIENSAADPTSGHVVSAEDVHDYAGWRTSLYANGHDRTVTPQFKGNLSVLNLKSLGPTSSGSLIDDELWDQNVTLSNNVIVSNGKKLCIYNSNVNLGSYYIKCKGSGQVIIKGSCNINPDDYRVVQSGQLKGFYPSMTSALSNATSGQTVQVSSGTYNENSLNISSGVTLDLNYNGTVTINFSSNSILEVYGNLEADDDVFQGQSGGYDYWRGIYVYNDCDINSCTIKNAEMGIKTINCSNPEISYNEIETCEIGVMCLNGGNYPNIYYNELTDIEDIGIDLISTPTDVTYNFIESGLHGVLVSSVTTNGDFSDNHINEAGTYGLLLTNGTIIDVSDCDLEGCDNACVFANYNVASDITPGNHILRSGSWSIYNANSSYTIDATDNMWNNMLNYGPVNTGAKLAKVMTDNPDSKTLYDQGVQYFENEQYDQALLSFKSLIIDYSDSRLAKKSFSYIMKIQEGKTESKEQNVTYFEDIKQAYISKDINNEMADYVDLHILYWLERSRQFDETEKKYDEMLAKLASDSWQNELKLRKSIFYIYEKKEPDKAIPLLKEVAEGDNFFTTLAENELKYLIGQPPLSESITSTFTTKLSDNYPNPFNPETQISYSIQLSGNVKLLIYNLLGQKVRTLVDAYQSPGSHTITWNGCDDFGSKVAAGIYLCYLRVGDFTATKKMVMMK